MNKHQIVNATWEHKETGARIFVYQKGSVRQTFNYRRPDADGNDISGFIYKTELKTNWKRIDD